MANETKPEYTREAIQKLHADNYTDLYIADLYGKTELEISRARKKSSYWEELNAPPVAESSTKENAPEVPENRAPEDAPEAVEESASKRKTKTPRK